MTVTEGILFGQVQRGPSRSKPVQRVQRASTRMLSRAYYAWPSPRPWGAGAQSMDFSPCSDSSPFSTKDHGGLTAYVPASWFGTSGPSMVDFPSESASPHRERQFCRVDTLWMPTEGRGCFLEIQEREGPRNLRRAQLGRVIGPHCSK